MKRQKNRRRAAVLVGCILLACIACVRLVTAYGVLRPSRPPAQLRLSAGKEWTGAVKLEEFGGLCWDATQQEVQDALAFCNSCTQFPREEEGALMLGMVRTLKAQGVKTLVFTTLLSRSTTVSVDALLAAEPDAPDETAVVWTHTGPRAALTINGTDHSALLK